MSRSEQLTQLHRQNNEILVESLFNDENGLNSLFRFSRKLMIVGGMQSLHEDDSLNLTLMLIELISRDTPLANKDLREALALTTEVFVEKINHNSLNAETRFHMMAGVINYRAIGGEKSLSAKILKMLVEDFGFDVRYFENEGKVDPLDEKDILKIASEQSRIRTIDTDVSLIKTILRGGGNQRGLKNLSPESCLARLEQIEKVESEIKNPEEKTKALIEIFSELRDIGTRNRTRNPSGTQFLRLGENSIEMRSPTLP